MQGQRCQLGESDEKGLHEGICAHYVDKFELCKPPKLYTAGELPQLPDVTVLQLQGSQRCEPAKCTDKDVETEWSLLALQISENMVPKLDFYSIEGLKSLTDISKIFMQYQGSKE